MKEPEGSYKIEENNEDLIIIRDCYHSSPKCGIISILISIKKTLL